MHWSRLIDAPLAMLIALFAPLAGSAAPYWAAFVWPLLVLFVVIVLLVELTDAVAGEAARLPVLALLAMSLSVHTEFFPGRVDHHNVQIALTLAMMLATIRGRDNVGWAAAAGAISATALAIGTEALPAVASVLVCFGLCWVLDPSRSGRQFRFVALAFAGSLIVHLVASRPIAEWLVPSCDVLSIAYVAAGCGYTPIAVIAHTPGQRLDRAGLRLALMGALGSAVGLLLFMLFPDCRGGPYGNLQADLARILMADIGEAQSVRTWLTANLDRPQVAILVLPLAGMAALLAITASAPHVHRWPWLVLAGFCLALLVVSVFQIRGLRLLTVAVLPAAAWIIATCWMRFRRRQTMRMAVLVVAALLWFSGMAHWIVLSRAYAAWMPRPDGTPSDHLGSCSDRGAYAELAALPPGNVMSYLLIGPQLLLETQHSVVSAGYHRNEAGLRDMVRFFGGTEADARAVIAERELDYLVFCRGVAPNGALAGVDDFRGLSWSWLVPVSLPDAPLQIYATRPASR